MADDHVRALPVSSYMRHLTPVRADPRPQPLQYMPHPERPSLHFGPFAWLPIQQSLLLSGKPVRMSRGARGILGLLLEQPGTLVATRLIVRRVWPAAGAEEATLRGHVSALRKVLRSGLPELDCVQNVIGHGYRFAVPVTTEARVPSSDGSASDNLPPATQSLFGRAHLIDALATRMGTHRLVTLVGAAGVGKTSVATATAIQLRSVFTDGVRFVDLGSVTVPSKVTSTLACALGLQSISTQPLAQILHFLKNSHLLIVLDNCEHVIDAAAHLAEALLENAPHVSMLATSRESLRARGEQVSRLLSLELPEETAQPTAAAALRFPAIQLFADSARRVVPEFKLLDRDAPAVVDICRKLDGLPLAIQLAAAQLQRMEIQGLAAAVQHSLDILASDLPATTPQHTTLRATLDWSYRLLPEFEQSALSELSIFAGRFDATSARAIINETPQNPAAVMNLLGDLTARSLLTVGECCGHVTYQLLATTRAYVVEKLQARTDVQEVRRRHVRMCCSWDYPWARSRGTDSRDWREMASIRIDDVRAALDWCFLPQGDAMLGAELAADSAPLWFALSLLEEHRDYLEKALAMNVAAPMPKNLRLKLQSALDNANVYTRGPAQVATAALRAAALDPADQNGDAEDQRRALWGLWVDRLVGSDYQAALELNERYRRLESNEPPLLRGLMLDLMIALTRHMTGDQRTARHHAQKILQASARVPTVPGDHAYHLDYRVSSRAVLGPILYLQGETDHALQTARESLELARNIGHTLSLCCALMHACTVALWAGKLDLATHASDSLLEQSNKQSLSYWQTWARCLGIAVRHQQGHSCTAEELHQFTKEPLCTGLHLEVLGTVASSLATETALQRAETGAAGWSTPELLRVKAQTLLEGQAPDIPVAEALLKDAINIARRQDALAWELRATTSLARLVSSRGHRVDAVLMLQPVLQRYSRGGMSRDAATAAKLLQDLRSHTGSFDHHFPLADTTRWAGNQ
jgi:predicted ATPase/DNA-binding winged helix-turn-helix (wHTH) protein